MDGIFGTHNPSGFRPQVDEDQDHDDQQAATESSCVGPICGKSHAGVRRPQAEVICCIISNPFVSPQRSTIRPFSMRRMSMPVSRTCLPVAGTPS